MIDIPPLVKEFNELWAALHVDERAFPNRKAATFGQWKARTPAARNAMKNHVDKNGPLPQKKNPFFWVQDFPEPHPTNLNGTAKGGRLMATGEARIASYGGQWGVYSQEDIKEFNLITKRQQAIGVKGKCNGTGTYAMVTT